MVTPCRQLLDCVIGESWPSSLVEEVARGADSIEGSRALFTELIEPLSDRFEARLSVLYGRVMSQLIGRPELAEGDATPLLP